MTIVELLAAVGADHLTFQKLDECVIRAQRVKRGCNITFGTAQVSADSFFGEQTHFGIVVWVPIEHARRVQAEIDARTEQPA